MVACTDFAHLNDIELKDIFPPYDNKVWNKLYNEFCKMMASKYFIPTVRETSKQLRGCNKDKKNVARVDNYEHAKEILAMEFQCSELEGNWDANNFVVRILNETVKLKTISNINTLLGFHSKRWKLWNFYDGLKVAEDE